MKTKPLFVIIITLVLIIGIGFFMLKPVVSSMLASWKALAVARESLKTIEEKKEVLDALKSNPDLTRVSEIAQKYIPPKEESGQLILELTAMAQTNNLKIEQTSLEKAPEQQPTPEATASPTPGATPTPASEIKTVDFSLKVAGTFPDFMNFLKTIETSSRLIAIKTISMQSKVNPDQTVTFSAQVSGSAYYKQDVTLASTLDNIKISQETIDQLLNLKAYGQPIDLPGESGFGRANPFENY